MMLARQNLCCERPADGASGTLRTVPQGRRAVLKAALGLGVCFSFFDCAFARGEDPTTAHPQEGDQFVFSSGDRDGQLVTPEYLPLGGPQQLAYPMDPRAKIVRNGSTLNLVALVRFDPAELAEETRALAADGVGADSAICTHPGCPVSMWQAQAKTLFCACHAAQYEPRDHPRGGDGPAPRRPPLPPIKMGNSRFTRPGGV